jgi:dynein intermediate chain
MVGTQNANNLMTGSTDGLVCSWLSDVLAQPQASSRLIFMRNLTSRKLYG